MSQKLISINELRNVVKTGLNKSPVDLTTGEVDLLVDAVTAVYADEPDFGSVKFSEVIEKDIWKAHIPSVEFGGSVYEVLNADTSEEKGNTVCKLTGFAGKQMRTFTFKDCVIDRKLTDRVVVQQVNLIGSDPSSASITVNFPVLISGEGLKLNYDEVWKVGAVLDQLIVGNVVYDVKNTRALDVDDDREGVVVVCTKQGEEFEFVVEKDSAQIGMQEVYLYDGDENYYLQTLAFLHIAEIKQPESATLTAGLFNVPFKSYVIDGREYNILTTMYEEVDGVKCIIYTSERNENYYQISVQDIRLDREWIKPGFEWPTETRCGQRVVLLLEPRGDVWPTTLVDVVDGRKRGLSLDGVVIDDKTYLITYAEVSPHKKNGTSVVRLHAANHSGGMTISVLNGVIDPTTNTANVKAYHNGEDVAIYFKVKLQ